MSEPSEDEIQREMRRLEKKHERQRFFSTGIQGHKYRREDQEFEATLRDRAAQNLKRKMER